MDYEVRYNSLVAAIKQLQEANPSDEDIQNWVEDNVPELAESEDEKIRKTLINLFKGYHIDKVGDFTAKEILAWLEKRGEQNPSWSDDDSFMLAQAIKCVNNSGKLDVPTEEIEDWLKSIKYRVQSQSSLTYSHP